MKYAILGGGGCFGMNTADYLTKQGHEVFCIGRNTPKYDCFTLNRKFDYVVGHLVRDFSAVVDVLKYREPDVIVNYAAQGEGAASFDPKVYWRYFDTNSTALARLTGELQGCKWLKRFIQVGTSELYGSVDTPAPEEAPIKPSSPYSTSKAAFDLHLLSIKERFPMNIIRPSNGYCPGQQLHRIIPKTIIKILKGEKVQLHGGGVARKSYIHGDDISRAIELISKEAPFGEVYNCGPLQSISIRTLVENISKVIESMNTGEMKVDFDIYDIIPERQGQDSQYWLDSTKLRLLCWKPRVDLWDGLTWMVKWVKSYPELLTLSTEYPGVTP